MVAFHGRGNTRFFGEATAGLTTPNTAFELSDGAVLYLPVSLFTDRTGLVYPGNTPIAPDQDTERTESMYAAIDWVSDTPACVPD